MSELVFVGEELSTTSLRGFCGTIDTTNLRGVLMTTIAPRMKVDLLTSRQKKSAAPR